jgi:hypothetical protein
MPIVTDTLTDAERRPIPRRAVRVEVVTGGEAGAFLPSGEHIVIAAEPLTDALGRWSVDLPPTSQLNPAGSFYRVRFGTSDALAFTVPNDAGPHNLRELLVDDPQFPGGVITVPGGGSNGQPPDDAYVTEGELVPPIDLSILFDNALA